MSEKQNPYIVMIFNDKNKIHLEMKHISNYIGITLKKSIKNDRPSYLITVYKPRNL